MTSGPLQSRRIAASGGVSLAADVGGNPTAPAVVLQHGGGQTRYSWGRCARDLVAAGYHVISLDLRGHGDSDWAPDGDYSLDAQVRDLQAVIATLPRPPALIGASLGGMTSLIAVGENAAPVASALVLVDVVPRIEAEGSARVLAFMSAHPRGFGSLEEVADAVARYVPHRSRPANIEGLRRNVRQREDGRWYWHWDPNMLKGVQNSAVADYIERMVRAADHVRVPTLLVRGAMSDVVSGAGVQDLAKLIPQVEFVDVAGAGHMVAGDENDVFNAAVEEFLQRTVPTRTSAVL